MRFGSCSVMVALVGLAGCSGSFAAKSGDADAGGGDNGDASTANPPINGVGADGGDAAKSSEAGHHDATAPDADQGSEAGPGGDDGTVATEAGPVVEAGPDGPAPGCPTGDLSCGGVCVPSDVHNCGTCGHDCTSLAHVAGATTCTAAGACSFPESACAAGWSNCDGNPDNGCETDVTKPATCGTCGNACPATVPVCSSGACVTGCPTGQALCSGACVDTTSNTNDCKTCGNVCTTAVAHAQPTCAASTCGFACNSTFTGCPTAAPTSCVDEQHDPTNCGACAKACPGPTSGAGQPACAAGACTLNCNAGLTACPTAAPTACDDTTTDLANCGSCGNVCSTVPPNVPANGHATCGASQCGFACNTGYQVCNGNSCVPLPSTNGVFVSAASGSGTACTQASPCGSINTAVAVATAGGKSIIYLDQGPHTEQVTLQGGTGPITLQGGWTYTGGSTWTTCNATSATIATSTAASVVQVLSGTWTLDEVIIANNTTASPGQTLHGVFATGGSFTLTNGSITVNKGGDGVAGLAATGTGGSGASGGCTTGGSGNPGSVGPYGTSGYNAAGYFSTAPVVGGVGALGTVGTVGMAGACLGCVSNSCSFDSADNICQCDNDACGATGLGGCGGQGGPGGGPAGAGGSSIGVFAWGATVNIQSPITAGNGGRGGDGGAGGGGGPPASGAKGASVTGYSCNRVGSTTTCNSGAPTVVDSGGTAGGMGGTGGTGGQGGGGNGGDSYCYYQGTGATIVAGGACTPGNVGPGGNQGTANPAPGGHQGHVP